MKKKILLIPAIAFLSLTFASCGPTNNGETDNTKVEFVYSIDDYISILPRLITKPESFSFDWKYLIEKDPLKYDKDIARGAALLAADSNDYLKFNVNSEETTDKVPLAKAYGVSDYVAVNLEASQYQLDKDDLAIFNMSHFDFKYNGKEKQIFNINLGGTAGGPQWASNFDFGYDGALYTKDKDEHPEWTNRKHHKGFDIASNRVLVTFNDYITTHKNVNADLTLFITGYSRGAALANLVGKYYQDMNIRNFTYTFETPNTVEAEVAKKSNYKNIYNVCNEDDFVAHVPTDTMGFARYGVDITLSMQDYKDEYNEKYAPREYDKINLKALQDFLDLFGDRKTIFSMPPYYYERDVSEDFDSEEEALEAYNDAKEDIAKLKCGKYFTFEAPKKDLFGDWNYRWKYAPATFIDMLYYFLHGDITSGLLVLSYVRKYTDQALARMGDIIGEQGIVDYVHHFALCHMPETFIEVVNHYKA